MQSSGLSDEEYSYSLRAHFDFVIADQRSLPLFAVEFDGPRHENDPKTIYRDELKRSLCDKLGLPLLRVDADYLRRRVGRFSLLGGSLRCGSCRRRSMLLRRTDRSP